MKSEKKRIEETTANLFLDLYNEKFGTHLEIDYLSDAPDVVCIDRTDDKVLNLEISLIEDLLGDVKHILGRGPKPKSPVTGTTVVSFTEDAVERLNKSLEDKLLSSYGSSTALVLRQVSPLWEPHEWSMVADEIRDKVLAGRERNFSAGVWIICTDNFPWPSGDALFCLSQPVE